MCFNCGGELENQTSCISKSQPRTQLETERGKKLKTYEFGRRAGTVENVLYLSLLQLCQPQSQHTCCYRICSWMQQQKGKTLHSPARLSTMSQLFATMSPLGISGVFFLILGWLKWKKACLLCQGPLNQDDLSLWAHTAGSLGGLDRDKWRVAGRCHGDVSGGETKFCVDR